MIPLPGRTLLLDGEEWLYFSGTAYLGAVQDPAFQHWVKEGIDRYGLHYGGSRLARLRLPVFEEVENLLCELSGAPAALVVSSGTVAGQLALRHFASTHTFFSAPDLHPALWPESYVPAQGPWEEWGPGLREKLESCSRPAALLSNALEALRARRYDFSWLQELPARQPLALLVDDSHGLGVTGPEGGGIYRELAELAPSGIELVVVGSLGKAFGIPAGVIFGQAAFIEALKFSPFFGGASPPSPAFLHAFICGQARYRENRQRLLERVCYFQQAFAGSKLFQSFQGYPVQYTPLSGMAERLAERRIFVSSFPYPTPADPVVTRVVINALHTQEDVDRVVEGCRVGVIG